MSTTYTTVRIIEDNINVNFDIFNNNSCKNKVFQVHSC